MLSQDIEKFPLIFHEKQGQVGNMNLCIIICPRHVKTEQTTEAKAKGISVTYIASKLKKYQRHTDLLMKQLLCK